jgi:hypothetical protein
MNGDTPINISVRAALAGAISMALALIAGAWLVFTLTFGNIGDDVSSIKDQLAKAQDVTREVETKSMEADTSIRATLSNIDKSVGLLTAELADFKVSVGKTLDGIQLAVNDLNATIGKLNDQYADINVRLIKIETVLTSNANIGPAPSPNEPPKLEQPKLEPQPLPQP